MNDYFPTSPDSQADRSAVRDSAPRGGVTPAGLTLLLIAWIAVLGLSLRAAGDNVIDGDVRIARWVQDTDSPIAGAVADIGNLIGTYWFGALLTLPVILALTVRRRWRLVALFVVILAIRALNSTVKGWIDSPRPTSDLVRVSERLDSLGFPSGHSFGAALFFGALALVAGIELPPGRARRFAVSAFLLLIPIVGFGRIYSGAHWPSDVLGGYLMGGAVLLTLFTLLRLGTPTRR